MGGTPPSVGILRERVCGEGGGRQEGEEEKGEGRGGARSAVRASAFESPWRVREGGGRSCSGGEVAWKDSRSLLSGVPPL